MLIQILRKLHLYIAMATALTMVGCSQSSSNEQLGTEGAVEDVAADSVDIEKKPVSLDKYMDISDKEGNNILLPLFMAKKPTPLPEEQMLSMFSGEYHNEKDAFKRRDIAEKIKPEIEKELEQYEDHDYYKILMARYRTYYLNLRLDDPLVKQAHLSTPTLGCGYGMEPCDTKRAFPFLEKDEFLVRKYVKLASYDFDREGFTVVLGDNSQAANKDSCLPEQVVLHNKQNIPLTITVEEHDTADVCFIPIKDESLARDIEAKKNYGVVGTLYLDMSANDDSLIGEVVAVTWDIMRSADPDKGEFESLGTVVASQTNKL